MRVSAVQSACVVILFTFSAEMLVAEEGGRAPAGDESPATRAAVLFLPQPWCLTVATLAATFDAGTISDVVVTDLDGDRRQDILVAWYATDNELMSANQRALTIFYNAGGMLARAPDINLYIPDYQTPAKSVFRNGTGAIAVGDFDGDGDRDVAVAPFFGDELWFLENLGQRQFAKLLCFPFGANTGGNAITPPDMVVADFDGDGRDDLAYLADPIQCYDGYLVHFWRTSSTLSNVARVYWDGLIDSVPRQWTRGLAVADFDGDGRPDLAFTGTHSPPQEREPVLTIWYHLTGYTFQVATEYPNILCADVVDVRPLSTSLPGYVLAGLNGTKIQYWRRAADSYRLTQVADVDGFAGLSPNRGMSVVAADVNGDGRVDLVTKQKLGETCNANQIELALAAASGDTWARVSSGALDTTGLRNESANQILRPRNLAVADLSGNALPEIVAGFGRRSTEEDTRGTTTLDIAVWENSCPGDVNLDGQCNAADLGAIYAALGSCAGSARYNANADVNKSGCVTRDDILLASSGFGCRCTECEGLTLADTNCDGVRASSDVEPFLLAMRGEETYHRVYPDCPWLNADCNGDGRVDFEDINLFAALLAQPLIMH